MSPLAVTLAVLAMTAVTAEVQEVTLDMAEDSFDDQYQGCRDTITAALRNLSSAEFQRNPHLARVWAKAEATWRKWGRPKSHLSPDQAIAIVAYTGNELYEEFNAAVRRAGSSGLWYHREFHYKSLDFLLADALATLWEPRCRCVFRGVDGRRFLAQPGDTVRFGQFASTSLCRKVAQKFGMDTVFQVNTCHGANIHTFSNYKGEQEVLVLPFETFRVTKVTQEGKTTRIHLNSSGTFSKYNCEWLRGGSLPSDPPQLGGLLLATVAMAVASGTL
ncbi:PREDICTED: NAD(P)(+)--arginine ADP-ribosyltransferase 2-like [Pseudopodoces humilis]|uniref:NAD(P)(+)--arginine ADP-ribosyltransferase 2-like n=1 Tax=Pseudopodoces humilis TaxID=181119 RepID=UPI0003959974|nr:PREDICTED: NAD(P)(+)--arginine ADP-ribosyltransferase 2-like [Pseudopodoces humilis]